LRFDQQAAVFFDDAERATARIARSEPAATSAARRRQAVRGR